MTSATKEVLNGIVIRPLDCEEAEVIYMFWGDHANFPPSYQPQVMQALDDDACTRGNGKFLLKCEILSLILYANLLYIVQK